MQKGQRQQGQKLEPGQTPSPAERAAQAAALAAAPATIDHPDLLTWWGISILASLLAVLLVRRQPWMRALLMMFAAVFFALIGGYVLSFVVSARPYDVNFVREQGWGYFAQLLVIGYLPLEAIRRFGKVRRRTPAPAPRPIRDFESVGH